MEKIFYSLERYFGRFELAVLDLEEGKRWIAPTKLESIPYLKRENAHGRHILIKPVEEMEPYFMMIDDIDMQKITREHQANGNWKAGRMCVETSPSNFQVWIHSSRSLSLEEKRHWLKLLGNDPGADPNGRWGRCPGFRNRKEKYRDESGGYPLAKLIWVDWKKKAQIPPAALPERRESHCPTGMSSGGVREWDGDISRSQYERGDESATDFAYAMALIRRGIMDEEIFHRIRSERETWANHKGERRIEAYLRKTIKRAHELFDERELETPSVPHQLRSRRPERQMRL